MNGAAARGKALPARPNQDLSFGGPGQGGNYGSGRPGGAQNGYRKENVDPRNNNGNVNANGPATQTQTQMQDNGRRAPPPEPSGRTVLEGYRQDVMSGFEEKPRYNPVSGGGCKLGVGAIEEGEE